MSKRTNILFTATFSASFIREDLKILQSRYSVTDIFSSGIKTLFLFLSHLNKTDITFSWFASVYSCILVFLTKLFNKKSIIVLGGVDVAKLPDLDYGIWNSWWKSIIVSYGIRHANTVIAVDESIKQDAIALCNYSGNNIVVAPTAHDASFWNPHGKKQPFVLTVATCNDYTRYVIKGIDFLIDVAEALPKIQFVLVGADSEFIKQFFPPPNLIVHGRKEKEELLKLYQEAKIYFQPSMREALGSALCEAMLCNCYPIGTDKGGIPTVIGDTGTIIEYDNVSQAAAKIKSAMILEETNKPRERILSHFSIQQREKRLFEIIEGTLRG